MKFKDFNFKPSVLDGIEAIGFQTPTPIQEETIPIIQAGKDLIGIAQTGPGKTAAFVLPIIDQIIRKDYQYVSTLILAPTRELVMQIDRQIEGLAYFVDISSIAVYGGGDGAAWDSQKNAFTQGADIVVATPGRLLSHLAFNYLDLSQLKHLVLDEADKMLDMGFYDDIKKILTYTPKERQSLLFSATMPDKINKLASEILVNPERISFSGSKPAEGVIQAAYVLYDDQKNDLIAHLLKDKEDLKNILVFTSTKKSCKSLYSDLSRKGFSAKEIHSDLEQNERIEVLREFKNHTFQILIATDILSRGIDIENIDLVINYDIPADAEDYVHRIGRTARAKSEGLAISLINEKDQFNFAKIEQLIETDVFKIPLPQFLGTAPEYSPKKNKGGKFKKFTHKKKKFQKHK